MIISDYLAAASGMLQTIACFFFSLNPTYIICKIIWKIKIVHLFSSLTLLRIIWQQTYACCSFTPPALRRVSLWTAARYSLAAAPTSPGCPPQYCPHIWDCRNYNSGFALCGVYGLLPARSRCMRGIGCKKHIYGRFVDLTPYWPPDTGIE